MPSLQSLRLQRSVGRALDGTTFPLSLKLRSEVPGEGLAAPEGGYSASIWVFCTISGLITLQPDGTIYGVNHSFALMLFGYGKAELLGKVGSREWKGPQQDSHHSTRPMAPVAPTHGLGWRRVGN